MEASHGFADAQQKLAELVKHSEFSMEDWNEAQTRFQFIDDFVLGCLGWQKPQIVVEQHQDGTRVDYLLGQPPKAILEAKRVAIHFDFPPSASNAIVRSLRDIYSYCKNARAAIEQVHSYCSVRGIPIGIVCNGPQLIIFQAITFGFSPFDAECFVFDGLESYTANFSLIWSILSPEGVEKNVGFYKLSALNRPRLPPKASNAIPDPFRYRYRNPATESLRDLALLLLEDIENHPEVRSQFYEECYVDTAANHRHLLLSTRVIENWYARANEANAAPAPPPISTKTNQNSTELILGSEVLAESVARKPIVVLGDVGVGKTSFFENLFENIRKAHSEKSILVHINLGTDAALTSDLREHIVRATYAQIREQTGLDVLSEKFVRSIYYQEIERFKKSIYGSLQFTDQMEYNRHLTRTLEELTSHRGQHLKSSLAHLAKGQDYTIIFVVDNADQRDFDVQQNAFVISQEIASSGNALVFVALRPSTFHTSKLTGALSGYENRVFAITPPPTELVIEKRLTFAARIADGRIAPDAIKNLRLNLKSISAFIRATLRSIKDNLEIQSFLGNITGGNVRLVIELVTGFFGSPNVDSKKIIDIEMESGNYKIPLHEFTKHALLGEYSYYNSRSSPVACNIFDIREPDAREHFLQSLIVSFLSSNVAEKNRDGYIKGSFIVSEMLAQGFSEDQTRWAIVRLAEHRLITTPHQHYREAAVAVDEKPDNFYFRATTIGAYHVRNWLSTFGYLDAMSTDTPIMSEVVREKIFQVASSFEISDRLTKAEKFRDYLQSCWLDSRLTPAYFDFSSILPLGEQSFEAVRNAIHAYGERKSSKARKSPRYLKRK